MKAKILIIEDEVKLALELKKFLINNDYQVEMITDFNNLLNQMIDFDGDLILLDLNLPMISGQFLCHEYRQKAKLPIIIVTSSNNEMDELMCISYGADDFITKPYNPLILLARIEAVLKRSYYQTSFMINYQNIQLDVSKSCLYQGDLIIDLSKNELKIFYYLLKKRGTIVSRDELMEYLWDSDLFVDDNTLTVNINRLRKKLDAIGLENIIITKRKQGYLIL